MSVLLTMLCCAAAGPATTRTVTGLAKMSSPRVKESRRRGAGGEEQEERSRRRGAGGEEGKGERSGARENTRVSEEESEGGIDRNRKEGDKEEREVVRETGKEEGRGAAIASRMSKGRKGSQEWLGSWWIPSGRKRCAALAQGAELPPPRPASWGRLL
eukprot:767675-Hanusia_phi.AAC.3